MASDLTTDPTSRVLDKRMLRETVAALQARLGLSHDATVTGLQAQAITLASGIKPEDRLVSSEILRMRQDTRESTDR